MNEGIADLFELSREFLNDYGYFTIFGLLFLETAIFIGMFVPGVIVLVLAGYASSTDILSPTMVLVTAMVGVIAGDSASYFFGRFLGERYINFPSSIHRAAKNNKWFLLFFHHVPLSRMFIPAFFGMNGAMKFHIWIIFDVVSALIFVTTYFLLGWTAHIYSEEVGYMYQRFNTYIVAVCFLLLAGWIIKVYRDKNTSNATKEVR
ncbi:MAG TPA: hypothetical protein DCS31_05910 [Candidatus Competibacteraceae bacterium]|nr:hypothetical protein [Candidatus Competibacteraceae bacterium]